MNIKIACCNCGEVVAAKAYEGIEDDDFRCDDCEQNKAEAAYERQCEDFHGGSGPLPLIEQQRQSLRFE